MRLVKSFSLLVCLLMGSAAYAGPVEPDLHRLMRDAEKPQVHYGPARVGWNHAAKAGPAQVSNPFYESLRVDSPAAIRAELKALLKPDWQIWVAFAIMILGLRRMRAATDSVGERTPATVISFPSPSLPRQQEAA